MSFALCVRVLRASLLPTCAPRPWSVTWMRFEANPRDMRMALNGMKKVNMIYCAFDRGGEVVRLTPRWFDLALGRLKSRTSESSNSLAVCKHRP